jgi:hypothetical protein
MSNQTQEPTEIFVSDVGTDYFIPTYDNDAALVNFDPNAASAAKMYFRMTGLPELLVRTATPSTRTINEIVIYGLEYVVVAADVAPYQNPSSGGFHQQPGPVSIQAHIEYDADHKWSSSIITHDVQGRPLKVVARLSV